MVTKEYFCGDYWSLVHEVCINHEVVIFQKHIFTTPYLVSVVYGYIAYLLNPAHTLLLPSDVFPGGSAHSSPPFPAIDVRRVVAWTYPPTLASPVSVPSHQKTFTCLPLICSFQILTLPPLPHPCHVYQTPVSTSPSMPPKSILTCPSAVVQLPPATTTAPRPPPSPYTLRIPLK